MKRKIGPLFITLALVVISGFIGACIGSALWQHTQASHAVFHDDLFKDIHLTENQSALLDAMEVLHADETKNLQAELALSNKALADLLETKDKYGDDIEQAIDNVHIALFELQKATVKHLYEMRGILEPHQKVIFDRHVSNTFRQYTQ